MAQPVYTYSGVCYTATAGQDVFSLTSTEGNPIGYLSPAHIHVRVSVDNGETWDTKRAATAFTFNNPATSIRLTTPATVGEWIDIRRITPTETDWVDFKAGSLLTAEQLNEAELFSLYCDQEIIDGVRNGTIAPEDAGVREIIAGSNVVIDPTDGKGSVTISSVQVDPGVTKIIAGDNIQISPSDGTGTVTITGQAGGGVPEAPDDGKQYGRQSETWTEIVGTGSGGLVYKGTIDVTGAAPGGLADGDFYVNTTAGSAGASWTGIGGEAVIEGDRVAYNGSSWQIIPSPGGGGGDYLPLTGGDLTGPLTSTSTATFIGDVTADKFIGDGSLLTNLPGGPTGDYLPLTGGDLTGPLTSTSSALFESSVNGSAFYSLEPTGTSALAKLSYFHFYLKDSTGDTTVEIKNDGSITAAGNIKSGTTGSAAGTYGGVLGVAGGNRGRLQIYANTRGEPAIQILTAPDDATTKNEVFSVGNSGSITAADKITMGSSTNRGQFKGICPASVTPSAAGFIDGQYNGTSVIEMKYDGSAVFAGSVTVGSANPLDGSGFGAIIRPDSSYSAYPETNSNSNTISIIPRNLGTTTVGIRADGSATFAGRVIGGSTDFGPTAVSTEAGLFYNNSPSQYPAVLARNMGGGTNFRGVNAVGATTIDLNSGGDANFTGTVTATVVPPSDARFKENITPAKPQLADVVALGGLLKNYDWNDDAPVNEELRSQRQLGLIAQEAAEVCPAIVKDIHRTTTVVVTPAVLGPKGRVITEAVTKEEDDSYKGISTDALIMKLIGAVTELTARVAELETEGVE